MHVHLKNVKKKSKRSKETKTSKRIREKEKGKKLKDQGLVHDHPFKLLPSQFATACPRGDKH